MLRHEAAQKVNESLARAGAAAALLDPTVEKLEIDLGATLVFTHGVHAIEQRKAELAVFRSKLVEELLAAGPGLLSPAEAPVEVEVPLEPEKSISPPEVD